MSRFLFLLVYVFSLSSCTIQNNDCISCEDERSTLKWTWIDSGQKEASQAKLVYKEFFGDGNALRFHQSLCVWSNKAFCINDGEECKVLDLNSKEWLEAGALPDKSHHNNAQFSNIFFRDGDQYPLLLLSRGSYAPDQNCVYIVRITETDGRFHFSLIKTIRNTIKEAVYNGSWVIDCEHKRLFLYTMTSGDYRVTEGNFFCVFSFNLPDITNAKDVTLGYEDVIDRWEYSYLTLQGGTYCNNYLIFNVQSLESVNGRKDLVTNKDVIAVNSMTGRIEAILPLEETIETEGIAVFDNKLYVSFKHGSPNQEANSVVFALYEYALPSSLIKN